MILWLQPYSLTWRNTNIQPHRTIFWWDEPQLTSVTELSEQKLPLVTPPTCTVISALSFLKTSRLGSLSWVQRFIDSRFQFNVPFILSGSQQTAGTGHGANRLGELWRRPGQTREVGEVEVLHGIYRPGRHYNGLQVKGKTGYTMSQHVTQCDNVTCVCVDCENKWHLKSRLVPSRGAEHVYVYKQMITLMVDCSGTIKEHLVTLTHCHTVSP